MIQILNYDLYILMVACKRHRLSFEKHLTWFLETKRSFLSTYTYTYT